MGKNILVVGHAFIINENRSIWSLLAGKGDFNVDVLVPHRWKSNLVGNVNAQEYQNEKIRSLYHLPTYFTGNGSLYFYHLFKTFKILSNNHYDYILINQESWSLSLLFLNLIKIFTSNRRSKTFLMIAQNIKKKKLRWILPLEKFNMLFVDILLGCCKETEDVFRWKGIGNRWEYFPLYYSDKLERKIINNKVDKKETLRMGYIGRLSSEKGLDTLINAFNIVKKDKQIELVIAGAGPLADDLNVDGIKYMGILPHDQVVDFYEQIDVLVLPSLTRPFWKEQFGRVIVEAVANGKLVIGSNSGAIPEVMGYLRIGYQFNEGDVDSLVDQIRRFIKAEDDGKHPLILEAAFNKNKQMFSSEAFINRFVRLTNE